MNFYEGSWARQEGGPEARFDALLTHRSLLIFLHYSSTLTVMADRPQTGDLVTLAAGEQEALRDLLRLDADAARRRCIVAEMALLKAACGLPVRPGTAALIRKGLAGDRDEVRHERL